MPTESLIKKCRYCHQEKFLEKDFYFRWITRKTGTYLNYNSYCKSCDHLRTKIWKKNNPERKKSIDSHYMAQEKNFVRLTLKRIFKHSVMYPKIDHERAFQRKGRIPNITLEELYEELILYIQTMKDKFPGSDGRICRYCLQPWTYFRPSADKLNITINKTNFSIDRFYTERTYEKGNIVFCCAKCNSTKKDSTKDMWIRFLEIDKELNG